MDIKNMIAFFIVALTCFSNSNTAFGQERDTITDFYEYANSEWLENTTIPENIRRISAQNNLR